MSSSLHLVVGLGKTGHSIARYLKRRNEPFIVFDTRLKPANLEEFKTEFPGIDIFLGQLPDNLYAEIKNIIVSPGVALEHPSLKKAQNMQIPIFGDIECLAREIKAPVIAITGTNGKSTVTTLVGEMAKAAGLSVAVAGNIGLPVLDLLAQDTHYDLWVLELSSFQLDLTYSLKPIAATILNISPDHLDRHRTYEAYIQAKQRIYNQATFQLYNREDVLTRPKPNDIPRYPERGEGSPEMLLQVRDEECFFPRQDSFGLNAPTYDGHWGIIQEQEKTYIAHGQTKLLAVDDLRIKGKHNWANALAACALVTAANISLNNIIQVLQNFAGLPHRSQWIRTFNDVDWINDSKGTNIGATLSAISGIGGSMLGKIVLIAGGQGKGADFSELREPVSRYVRMVVLIGEDASKIQQALLNVVPIIQAASLEDAVNLARHEAQRGDVVLLSPACASLDMFRDFNHRGEVFAEAVNALC